MHQLYFDLIVIFWIKYNEVPELYFDLIVIWRLIIFNPEYNNEVKI